MSRHNDPHQPVGAVDIPCSSGPSPTRLHVIVMRLRIALKIVKRIDPCGSTPFGPYPRWRSRTVEKAKAIGRRKWLDDRFPFIESEEEESERGLMLCSILLDAIVDDPDERDRLKQRLWDDVTA